MNSGDPPETRRARLRRIRTRLAELLKSGHLGRLFAEHPYVHPEPWVRVEGIERYAGALLAAAERLEAPRIEGFRGSEPWCFQAERTAQELE